VELHGGQVSASSDGPGTGATFLVRLPLRTIPADDDVRPAVDVKSHEKAPTD
jgi:hypothetical protein